MNNKKLREYAAGKKVRHELSKEDAEQFKVYVDEIASKGGGVGNE